MKSQLQQRARKGILAIEGVVESPGIFGEHDAFWVNGKQIAHFLDDDHLQLRLTRRVIAAQRGRLRTDPRVQLRSGMSDWLKLRISSNKDLPFALELTELAASAHRPGAGVPAKPPPIGADLARRRRFH